MFTVHARVCTRLPQRLQHIRCYQCESGKNLSGLQGKGLNCSVGEAVTQNAAQKAALKRDVERGKHMSPLAVLLTKSHKSLLTVRAGAGVEQNMLI